MSHLSTISGKGDALATGPAPGRLPRSKFLVAGVLLAGATVLGAAGFYELLSQGHVHDATSVHIPWGIWVAGYIYFLGLSTGAFFVSSMAYVFGVRRLEPVGPLALVSSLICLLLAGMFIMADLGHPSRMHLVMLSLNPTSPMAWMSVLYSIYIAVVLGHLYLLLRPSLVTRLAELRRPRWFYRIASLGSRRTDAESITRDRRRLRLLGIAGVVVTVLLLGCEASIFAVTKARGTWFGGLFPVVILVSAVASGAALVAVLAAVCCRTPGGAKVEIVRWLVLLAVGVLALEAYILAAEALTTMYGGIEHEAKVWAMKLTGEYALGFWGVQVGVGMVLPAVLVALPATRRRTGYLAVAGLAVVVGMIATRWNMVIPSQIIPVMSGMGETYHHARFQEGYFPSRLEWLVSIGALAAGGWMAVAAWRLLPLDGSHDLSSAEGAR